MNDLNSILLEGNLARDPVLTTTPNGASVCNFTIGTHAEYKKNSEQQRETSFFNVEAWSKLGENCAEYLRKGRGVRVVGRVKQDRWQDANGQPRSRVKVVAEHVEFRPMRKRKDGDPEDVESVDAGDVDSGVTEETIAAAAEGSSAEEELAIM